MTQDKKTEDEIFWIYHRKSGYDLAFKKPGSYHDLESLQSHKQTKVVDYKLFQKLHDENEALRAALEFYGDEQKYFMRKRTINLQETTAVFKVDDPSKLPTEYVSEVFECSVAIKVDQGKKAREVLAKHPRGKS